MAVYSFLDDADFANIAEMYGFGGIAHATPIAEGVENSNYLLELRSGEKAIFTMFEGRVDGADLPYFLRLKQHLHMRGYACPTPILTQNGDISCVIQDKHAAVVSFLQGKSVVKPTTHHTHQAGIALAKLHLAGADFNMHRNNSVGYAAWLELRQKIAIRAVEAQHLEWLALIDDELEHQAQHSFNHLPSGVIHADFFPNNVFFDKAGKLCGVIDFYFACNDAYAYDLAIVANAWCCDASGELLTSYYEALLAGLNSVRQLTTLEHAAMPNLLRAAALRFLLTRLADELYPNPNALLTPHNPHEYVKKLLHFRHSRKSGNP